MRRRVAAVVVVVVVVGTRATGRRGAASTAGLARRPSVAKVRGAVRVARPGRGAARASCRPAPEFPAALGSMPARRRAIPAVDRGAARPRYDLEAALAAAVLLRARPDALAPPPRAPRGAPVAPPRARAPARLGAPCASHDTTQRSARMRASAAPRGVMAYGPFQKQPRPSWREKLRPRKNPSLQERTVKNILTTTTTHALLNR